MSIPVMEAHSGAFRSIPVIISTEMYSSFQVAWAAVCSKVVVLLLLVLCLLLLLLFVGALCLISSFVSFLLSCQPGVTVTSCFVYTC